MKQEDADKEMQKVLFANLVMMLSSMTLQQLGRIKDPSGAEGDINLEAAQLTIDMLEMLRDKTAGNLDTEEKRIIEQSLAQLQMTYVEASNQAAGAGNKASEPAPDKAAQAPEPAGKPDATAEPQPRPEPREPKFHKSYGG